MKNFNELKIGDSVYRLNDNLQITSVLIDGIRKRKSKLIELFIVDFEKPINVNPEDVGYYSSDHKSNIFSCLESVNEEKNNRKKRFLIKTEYEILSKIRSIKRVENNLSSTRKRILNLLQIVEEETK